MFLIQAVTVIILFNKHRLKELVLYSLQHIACLEAAGKFRELGKLSTVK